VKEEGNKGNGQKMRDEEERKNSSMMYRVCSVRRAMKRTQKAF